jgi:hypothetical protein
LQNVTLDPAIAEILGQSTVVQAFAQTAYLPSFGAGLGANYRNWGILFNYDRTAFPSNGIFQTTFADMIGGNYSYTGIRKWNFGASGGANRMRSFGPNLNPLTTYFAGSGITYSIADAWHLTARYDYRWVDSSQGTFGRNGSRALLGIAWSPGEIPLSRW